MKTSRLLPLLFIAAALPAHAGLLLNEIYLDVGGNSSGDNSREFVEILSTTGSDSLNDVWLLEIEGDGTTAGTIDMARNLTGLSFFNSLLTLGQGYSTANPWGLTSAQTGLGDLARGTTPTIENGGITFMLVTGFTGTVGVDLDADNLNGLDSTPWTAILDSVSNRDSALGTDILYGPDLMDGFSFTPLGFDVFARLNGDATPSNLPSWYAGQVDVSENFTANVRNLPAGATLTPGAVNFPQVVPEPASGVLVALGAVLMRWTRRARRA